MKVHHVPATMHFNIRCQDAFLIKDMFLYFIMHLQKHICKHPSLAKLVAGFLPLGQIFSEKCKNMRNWKKSERELMVQFSRYMLFVVGGAESREMTSEAFCYVEWPTSPAKPFPCLSLHLQASLCHSVCTPLFKTPLAILIFVQPFYGLTNIKSKYRVSQ